MKMGKSYLWLIVMACMLSLGSCIKEDTVSEGSQSVSVNMSVNTRAGSGMQPDTEDVIKSLRVYAFIGNNQIGYHYQDAGLTVGGDGKIAFWMDLEIPAYSAQEQEVCFYLIANEASVRPVSGYEWKQEMTRSELENYRFNELLYSSTSSLPMAIKHIEKINPKNVSPSTGGGQHEGHQMWNGRVEFELERAVGKLGMYFAAKDAGLNLVIEQIQVLNLHEYNYMFEDREKLKNIPLLHNEGFTLLTTRKPITDKILSDDDYKGFDKNNLDAISNSFADVLEAPAYMFENYYGSADPNKRGDDDSENKGFVLRVTYSVDNRQSVKDIYLPPIERNRCYNVLNRIGADDVITVDYTVDDWADGPKWNLDFQYPNYNNPLLPESGDMEYAKKPEVFYVAGDEEAGAFSVLFRMKSPEGQSWTPILLDTPETEFKLKVYKNGVLQGEPPYEVSDDFYTIKVIACKPENVGEVTHLGITYTPTWSLGTPAFLLINGESSEKIEWPDSGRDPQLIQITQVAP